LSLFSSHTGFGQHGHADMEIVTYVVHGGLYHKDSMGTKETLGRGAIQFMTAGTGVRHEEYNHEDKPLRFIQTWINPRGRRIAPNYGSSTGSLEGRKNQLHHLVSDFKNSDVTTPAEINQDVDAFATELDLGKKVEMKLPEGRMAYLLCVEGGVKVNGQQLKKYDACEITGSGGKLEIEATDVEETETGEVAHVLMFSMNAEEGAGRSDF
jgi:redox-sensitive bicupin YhaK (pirin superfamily)